MSDFTKLIEAHDGDMALYYIWLCVNGSAEKEQAAKDLCMTMSRINSAEEMLRRYDISPANNKYDNKEYIKPSEEPHQYTSQEISDASASGSAYSALLSQCERALGRNLTKDDMSKLLNIYKNLDLGADVIYVLLQYFSAKSASERITMTHISSVAYIWANKGIHTAEEAEEWVENKNSCSLRENKIKSLLGINTKLTGKTTELIDSWISSDYSDEMIFSAYEITIEKTGKLSWSYLNKVLENMSRDTSKTSQAGYTANRSREPESELPDTIIRRKKS